MSPINNKLVAALLLLASPAFAEGVCIVCPPGYDCSGPTPVLASGTAGQVLTRTATGAEWKALPVAAAPTWASITGKPTTFAPAEHTHDYVPTARTINGKALSADITLSASDVGVVPTSRKVAGLELSGDITKGNLMKALNLCNGVPQSGFTIEGQCYATIGTLNQAGNPTGEPGKYCWCRFHSSVPECGPSAWVGVYDNAFTYCEASCADTCSASKAWRAASTW